MTSRSWILTVNSRLPNFPDNGNTALLKHRLTRIVSFPRDFLPRSGRVPGQAIRTKLVATSRRYLNDSGPVEKPLSTLI